MTLKVCTCLKPITSREALHVQRNVLGLWFTCPSCLSTAILRAKNTAKYIQNLKNGNNATKQG